MVLSRGRIGICVDNCIANMPFAGCEQELVYCRRLRGAIDANTEVAERVLVSQCRFFCKPDTNI